MGIYNHLLKHTIYPMREWHNGTRVLPILRLLESSQYFSEEQLYELQLQKLKALLQHAYEHTQFYHDRFKEAGITPATIHDFDDLRLLPPLTKEDIVLHLDDIIARNFLTTELHRSATGGSSGRYTPFYRDNNCLCAKLAAQFRFNKWTGWDIGERAALVWPALQDIRQPKSLKDRLREMFIDRSLMLPAGSLNEAIMSVYAARLYSFRPMLIRAFPNPLSVIARYLQETNQSKIHPVGIVTVGEPLLPSQRQLFEQVFQCPVFDCYVSRECGHIASECEKHQGLHINVECLHLEFERNGKPVRMGEPGSILITDFENYGMPFIRYEIGDIARSITGSCSCGRTLPCLDFQAGRISDFVVSPHDGSLISGASLCHYLIAEGPDVGQLQIIQDFHDHLIIRVSDSGNHASKSIETDHIRQVITKVFHGKMRISFEAVKSIPHEQSGKYRFCISRYLEPMQKRPIPSGKVRGGR